MKALCITGVVPKQLEQVAGILQQAGMNTAAPSGHDSAVDIAYWHEQVSEASKQEESEESPVQLSPSRLWEQLASDIFLANVKSNIWGWANTNSIPLLEFLLNFERRLSFVLVCTSPQHMLARALTGDINESSAQILLDSWQRGHEQLLRFYNRNPQRCVLVDAEDCTSNPALLIKHCNQKLKLTLDTKTDFPPKPTTPQILADYLARNIAGSHSQSIALQHELNATLTRLSPGTTTGEILSLQPDGLISNYRSLCDRSSEEKQLQNAIREIAALKTAEEESSKKHSDAVKALVEQYSAEMKAQATQFNVKVQDLVALQSTSASKIEVAQKQALDELNAKIQHQQMEFADKLKYVTQENELLLLQLHQVQEDFESALLKHESDKAEIDALTHVKHSLEQEVAKLLSQRERELAQLEHEKAQLLVRLNTPIESKSQTAALQTAQAQLREVGQENELLLLQLHQVQEELEHHFLQQQESKTQQQQESKAQLQRANERWQRMLERDPDYCDYESIEVISAAADGACTWKLLNLSIAGRTLPELVFDTCSGSESSGLTLRRAAGAPSPLLRWPTAASDQNELSLIVTGNQDLLNQVHEYLLDLLQQDVVFLRALIQLLTRFLDRPGSISLPPHLVIEPLRGTLAKLDHVITTLPATFRYNRVTLKREQVNHDYEHLWLHFENPSFGTRQWPNFEFKLASANVQPKLFGNDPKLEFPESLGQAPFDSWFIESYDDFGAKLELRFALPDAMDTAVWWRLSAQDRLFVQALIARLPAILIKLEDAKVRLKRPWEDWRNLAAAIQRIASLRTTNAIPDISLRQESEERSMDLSALSHASSTPMTSIPTFSPEAPLKAKRRKSK